MKLLAKSRTHGELLLQQHLLDTEQAAFALFNPDTRWGRGWPRFFRLPAVDHDRFLLELRAAALFHDIGKANQDFQSMVGGGGRAQTLRHEHLSALVLMLPEVRTWLGATVDADAVTAAVLSHHLKASAEGDHRWGQARAAPTMLVHFEDEQVKATLDRIRQLLNLGAPPALPTGTWRSSAAPWSVAMAAGHVAANQFARAVRRDAARRQRTIALKTALIAADGVASGVVRNHGDIELWVAGVAHQTELGVDEVQQKIITPRLTALSARAGRTISLHPFQASAAQAGPRVLLLAACGTGKTLAAWAWANEQAKQRPLGRVIFLYPTRGTATEGFRDYAAWAPEAESMLLHGTARFELEQMHENPPESARAKMLGPSEAESRMYALGLWSRRFFSATVDQFLGALEHRYESVCLLPALADAAVIIDEVHSFDRRMFDNLVSFLEHFDVPVLCMTATLPGAQREQLERVGLRAFPNESEAASLVDLAAKERAPRYLHCSVADAERAMGLALEHYTQGDRVLWVVNTVARAQDLTRQLEGLAPRSFCYHSRFRLSDRQKAHERAVTEFQQRTRPVVAVTTQVCEMSLDLDADVLITEHAPVTSLVQRFGRANRHLANPKLGLLVSYPPEKPLPYEREELETAARFLGELGDSPFSQFDLAAQLARHAESRRDPSDAGALLRGGYFAVPEQFRETDDYTVPCVLSADVQAVLARLEVGSPIDGFVVPVPRRFSAEGVGLPPWLRVAESLNYLESRGFIAPEE